MVRDIKPLANVWLPHFNKQNPHGASVIGRKLGTSRINAPTLQAIAGGYGALGRVQTGLGILVEEICIWATHASGKYLAAVVG